MKFYYKAGIVDEYTANELIKLAKLRNLIVHRYREVDNNRVLEEARRGGIEVIRRVLDGIRRFIEG